MLKGYSKEQLEWKNNLNEEFDILLSDIVIEMSNAYEISLENCLKLFKDNFKLGVEEIKNLIRQKYHLRKINVNDLNNFRYNIDSIAKINDLVPYEFKRIYIKRSSFPKNTVICIQNLNELHYRVENKIINNLSVSEVDRNANDYIFCDKYGN